MIAVMTVWKTFLSTPSARRATAQHLEGVPALKISIHALCEEGDRASGRCCSRPGYFYPRPLRGGRPGRRPGSASRRHFYPRPLRGGRRERVELHSGTFSISIHALCEEGDRAGSVRGMAVNLFLSTPSARRATGRAGGVLLLDLKFLSTPSARRATIEVKNKWDNDVISIHALCEEGDDTHQVDVACVMHFYPRPLRGGRRFVLHGADVVQSISIHALCEEGDVFPVFIGFFDPLFLSTPSARRATMMFCSSVSAILFLSTPSARRATFVPNRLLWEH